MHTFRVTIFCATLVALFKDDDLGWQYWRWTWKCDDKFCLEHLQQGTSCTSLSSFKHLQKSPKVETQTWNENLNELISYSMITKLLPNIFDYHDLSICGNAYMVKAHTKFRLSCPFFISREAHNKWITLEDQNVTTNMNLLKEWNFNQRIKPRRWKKKTSKHGLPKSWTLKKP